MSFIEYCDFFDVRFHFYTNSQPSNRSIFGGIMSIIFLICSIGAFFYLEHDEIFHTNPITSKSEIPLNDLKTVKIGPEKIWVPFRMVTYEEKFIDHRGTLYPIVSLIKGKKTSDGGMDLKYITLNYSLCNETSMANKSNNYKIDIELNELFCINENDINFGGSWHSGYVYFIEINLFLCEDGIDFDANDPKCTKFTDLLKKENTSWLFEFYYPVVQFKPANLNDPMAVIYRSYFYRLSSYTNKVERVYLQENILSDDRSILFANSRNSSFWGLSSLYGDTYFLPTEKDLLVKSSSSRLYSLVIYLDSGLIYYTRYYKKIPEILGEVFPILNLIFFIFKKFIQIIKISYTKKQLFESIFENKPLTNGQIEKLSKFDFTNIHKCSIKDINQRLYNILVIKNNTNIHQKDEIYKNLFISRSNNNLIRDNNMIDFSMEINKIQQIGPKNNKNKREDLGSYLKGKFPNYNPKQKFIKALNSIDLFPLSYYLMDIFTDRIPSSAKCFSKCQKYNNYILVHNFMCKIFDISSHVMLFKHFNIIKNIFLEERNLAICNEKINIKNKELMEEIKSDLKGEEYFVFFKSLLFSE